MADLAPKNAANEDIVTAILTSSFRHPDLILLQLLDSAADMSSVQRVVQHLVQLLASRDNPAATETVLAKVGDDADTNPPAWKLSILATILDAHNKQGRSRPGESATLARFLKPARGLVANPSASEAQQLAAIRLLGRDQAAVEQDAERLVGLLSAQNSLAVQRAALTRIGQLDDPAVPKVILARWKSAGPQSTALLSVLLRRPEWTEKLLDQVGESAITVGDLGATIRQELLAHRSDKIRNRAETLVQQTTSDRETIVSATVEKVTPLNGDSERGRLAFETHCAACHRAGSSGRGNGPNLAMLYDRGLAQLVTAILDPNRAVEDKYRSYNADLKNGEQISGILLNESGNSVTLMNVTGAEQTILRQEIESLTSSSRSMMPEGFEQFLQPQDFADLLAFIRSTTAQAKQFAGNQPKPVAPDQRGCLRLTAVSAEIYGDTLAFEGKYGNLGYWSSQNDRAVWTVDLPAPATFDVWLDFACPTQTAGNKFVVQVAGSELIGTVPTTKSWDVYKQQKFGTLKLPAGQTRIIVRSEAAIRNNVMDLREIRLAPPTLRDTAFALPK